MQLWCHGSVDVATYSRVNNNDMTAVACCRLHKTPGDEVRESLPNGCTRAWRGACPPDSNKASMERLHRNNVWGQGSLCCSQRTEWNHRRTCMLTTVHSCYSSLNYLKRQWPSILWYPPVVKELAFISHACVRGSRQHML